jgi:hypothetical protein
MERLNSLLLVSALWAGVVMTVGCGSQGIGSTDIPLDTEVDSAMAETATVSVAKPAQSVSPAVTQEPIAEDESPEVVCRRFLQQLNRENVDEFEMLLTPAAMTIANRLDFHLPPVADANSRFELSDPRYSTNREKLCYIDSTFSGGKIDQARMTWMLRKTKSGWRVAGMLIAGTQPDTQNLLSFENTTDINQIKASLTGDVSAALATD